MYAIRSYYDQVAPVGADVVEDQPVARVRGFEQDLVLARAVEGPRHDPLGPALRPGDEEDAAAVRREDRILLAALVEP